MPLAVEEVTLLTVGGVVSMTRALLPPSELPLPVAGSVSVPALPARSVIVPPLRASEVVAA